MNLSIHKNNIDPESLDFEVVERKFRGHPDSLSDMVAQRFSQLYIKKVWSIFPELENKAFPNFSADKVTLSGASIKCINGSCEVSKPVHALLIGKITKDIGKTSLSVESIFKEAVDDIFLKSLGHSNASVHTICNTYITTLAGVDHDAGFYNPESVKDLLSILSKETHANDTVYVVAYSPLSETERLTIYLDNLTASPEFQELFPEIGSDIKALIRRRKEFFDITICLPVFPEKVFGLEKYEFILKKATEYIESKIVSYLNPAGVTRKAGVRIRTNTKDTVDRKYFAVWGTALSKGDIGAVGRGNRPQGFISGMRPSTNEAVSGKNPNHFSGIVYQFMAEHISNQIYFKMGLSNTVYITADNGDMLNNPNSIDIMIPNIALDSGEEEQMRGIVKESMNNIDMFRLNFINGDVYKKFMQ
jgi:S-adenosylmethionine synthetase